MAVVAAALLAPVSAQAITYAPVDQPGPPLSVPQAELNASLTCNGNLATPGPGPVLLVPGTGSNPPHNFGWNWEPALNKLGIPWCAVTLPNNALNDIQVAGEYVVNGIRTMYAQSGRRIALIGHSQGGMVPRWALRFWPDTRAMVNDQIGLAPSNHGTIDAQGPCTLPCPAAFRQQSSDAEFIKALNSYQETFPGISYTEIYTHTDEVVQPNSNSNGSSSVHGGGGRITNVATQDVCPTDTYEHLNIGTVDPVAYALAIDALEHSGPASVGRIPQSVCTQVYQPGVDPANSQNYLQVLAGAPGLAAVASPVNVVGVPTPKSEPALRCYVFASCPAGFGQATCLNVGGKPSGKHVGPVVLGRKRTRIRAALGSKRNRRTRKGLDRWCVRGGGILEAGYPTKRLPRAIRRRLKGKAVIGLASSRRFSIHRVRAGVSSRTARRRLHGERRYRVGRNVWLVARAKKATVIVRTRRGRVKAVGLAARTATRSHRSSRHLLGAWKL
jgi:triacylglycerol esterase/lipase EstA (alpha/beta hydrolase family)